VFVCLIDIIVTKSQLFLSLAPEISLFQKRVTFFWSGFALYIYDRSEVNQSLLVQSAVEKEIKKLLVKALRSLPCVNPATPRTFLKMILLDTIPRWLESIIIQIFLKSVSKWSKVPIWVYSQPKPGFFHPRFQKNQQATPCQGKSNL